MVPVSQAVVSIFLVCRGSSLPWFVCVLVPKHPPPTPPPPLPLVDNAIFWIYKNQQPHSWRVSHRIDSDYFYLVWINPQPPQSLGFTAPSKKQSHIVAIATSIRKQNYCIATLVDKIWDRSYAPHFQLMWPPDYYHEEHLGETRVGHRKEREATRDRSISINGIFFWVMYSSSVGLWLVESANWKKHTRIMREAEEYHIATDGYIHTVANLTKELFVASIHGRENERYSKLSRLMERNHILPARK